MQRYICQKSFTRHVPPSDHRSTWMRCVLCAVPDHCSGLCYSCDSFQLHSNDVKLLLLQNQEICSVRGVKRSFYKNFGRSVPLLQEDHMLLHFRVFNEFYQACWVWPTLDNKWPLSPTSAPRKQVDWLIYVHSYKLFVWKFFCIVGKRYTLLTMLILYFTKCHTDSAKRLYERFHVAGST